MKIGKKMIFLIFALAAAAEVYHVLSRRIIIIADGKRRIFYTDVKMVNDILFKAKIKVDDNDIAEPPLQAELKYPKIIKIIRVEEKIEEKVENTKPKIIYSWKSSANLRPVKYEKLKSVKNISKIKVVTHDGSEVKREVVETKKETKIEELLTLLDKKSRYPIKIYNLSKSPKKKMIATAYYPGDPLAWRDGTITFLGLKMQRGMIAVDPKVIPLRTRLYVPGYGYGYAADTGNLIKGDRIDLGVTNVEEEKPWMHRPVTVYILGPSKTW